MNKVNILIVGSGHYSTGTTVLSGKKATDQDCGVLLPSALELRARGVVDKIAIAARDGKKLSNLSEKITSISKSFNCSDDLIFYPQGDRVDDTAYKKAIQEMPRPCVVLIAVPDHIHMEVMSCCIENSLPFMVVKPAVTKLEDLYILLEKLEKNPVLAMVDYHKVYDDANIMLKEEYQTGMYGNMQHFTSLMTHRRDMIEIFSRSLNSEAPPNVNHYLGSHYIHMAGFITGAEPQDVRAISQSGVAGKMLENGDIADIIETQIRWKGVNNKVFTSYHISGWSDPSETESMTYQEVHLLCENGHIDSDQRYRGFRKVLSGEGCSAPNPYFFSLNTGPGGNSLDSKYGFLSVKTFVESCIKISDGDITLKELEGSLPTLRESDKVTAILEAADLSLENDSSVIRITRNNNKYHCLN